MQELFLRDYPEWSRTAPIANQQKFYPNDSTAPLILLKNSKSPSGRYNDTCFNVWRNVPL